MPRAARLLLAVAVLAAAAAAFFWWDFRLPALGGARYQAVFLANGQTYFGRYTDRLGPYVIVEDVHYIQTTRNEQDPDAPADQRLVRRGGEPHAPLARVLIPKSSILFVEDLAPGSPIGAFMDGRR